MFLFVILALLTAEPAPENPELAKMYREDQSDRMPPAGSSIDLNQVGHRDAARLARVKQMYTADELKTGADYYHAAMILQHGQVPEDYLLAHEFCVVALALGEKRAAWLAAATEDRFLMNVSRPQRFGTQFRSDGPNQPMKLYTTDGAVTDSLRTRLSVPSLSEAKAREARMNSAPPASQRSADAGR